MFLNRGEGRVCDLATPTMIEVKLVEVSNERLAAGDEDFGEC
jgi:hypothetical protein